MDMIKVEMSIATIIGDNRGKWICFTNDADKGWYVQNHDSQQNVELFVKGIDEIFRMQGKRGAFLRTFVLSMCNTMEEVFDNKKGAHERYCNFIAFVCDFANHKNLKKWEGVYHKNFNKFVSNLCWNYYLDTDWECFKEKGTCFFNYYSAIKNDGFEISIN